MKRNQNSAENITIVRSIKEFLFKKIQSRGCLHLDLYYYYLYLLEEEIEKIRKGGS